MPCASSVPIRRSIAARACDAGRLEHDGIADGSEEARVNPPRIQRRETSLPRARAKTETEISVGDPLNNLLSRLAERMDIDDINPASMKNQERWSAARAAIAETFLAMQTDGLVHPGLDMRGLAHAALHEAVGLGALDDLLSDESVRTIVVNGPEKIFVDKGEGLEATSLQFSSTARRSQSRAAPRSRMRANARRSTRAQRPTLFWPEPDDPAAASRDEWPGHRASRPQHELARATRRERLAERRSRDVSDQGRCGMPQHRRRWPSRLGRDQTDVGLGARAAGKREHGQRSRRSPSSTSIGTG